MSVPALHRFTWDLDRTYLCTDFDSLAGLLRAAFEPASDKRTFPGATVLLRALKRTREHRLHILSGSPRQLRRTLEEKLALDGVMWDAFELKPNLENVLHGRFRAVREQVGYKLEGLLAWRAEADTSTQETLVGDDVECDAFIYSLYADLVSGRVPRRVLHEVLELSGCHPDKRQRIDRSMDRLVLGDTVSRILIHLDRHSPPGPLAQLSPRLVPFHNYFQAAVILYIDGLLPKRGVLDVAQDLACAAGYGTAALANSLSDLLRRGHLAKAQAQALASSLTQMFGGHGFEKALRQRPEQRPTESRQGAPPDYVASYRRSHGED